MIYLSWEDTHRVYHHDRPAPDYYTEKQRAIWDAQERWHPDCPFCKPARATLTEGTEDAG